MTALTAAPAPPRGARPARSRHLVSVPTGDAALAHPATRLRMTRRGRLAVTTSMLLVASVAGAAMAFGGPATQPEQVTVRSGQTLGQIAAAELPELPVQQGVARLQVANGLSTSYVHAGQTLTIPTP
ncbi:MAG: peptidoglycan-binding protein [Kytococcus sp.]|nr:peptidoglycan-binding protein [Kytococcus sp.]